MIRYMFITAIFVSHVFGNEIVLPPPVSNGFRSLTTYQELTEYVQTVCSTVETVHLDTLGVTVDNRWIPVLRFTGSPDMDDSDPDKIRVLVYCQQHGNEPGGKEAALLLIDSLIRSSGNLLSLIDLVLVPQVNPDGAERGERRNANGADLNRNHVILSEIESRCIHRLFLTFMPHVTLDVHEYGAISDSWIRTGMVKDAEVMLGGLTNLNVNDRILRFSRNTIIPEVGSRIVRSGYSFHRYVVGNPFEGGRMRYSTTDINDGRTSMGLYQTFSFIQEGKRYPDQSDSLRRRVESQFLAIRSFLEVIAENADSIRWIVEETRNAILEKNAPPLAIVQSDYFPDSTETTLRFPVFDLHEWKRIHREIPGFEPLIRAKKSVTIPQGYCIPGSEVRLIEVLRRHGIRFGTLAESRDFAVEEYRIKHVTPMEEEELTVPNVDVDIQTVSRRFEDGSIIVPTRQPARLVIPLLLEPQSTRGLVTEGGAGSNHFGAYLEEGSVYPVYRIPHLDTDLRMLVSEIVCPD